MIFKYNTIQSISALSWLAEIRKDEDAVKIYCGNKVENREKFFVAGVWSDVRLTGISVARQQERGKKVIVDCANGLARHLSLNKEYSSSILFNTDYLYGGYEQYSTEMKEYLNYAMRETGLVFDTTYSGKAFYGMMDILNRQGVQGNVLFWHTGGIMNVQK